MLATYSTETETSLILSSSYRVDPTKTAIYRYSFFSRTTIDWNNWQYPLLAPSVRGPQMVWGCVCLCVYTGIVRNNWHMWKWHHSTYCKFIPSTHTHTHTLIKPFEDSEPTGLKVDTAEQIRTGNSNKTFENFKTHLLLPLKHQVLPPCPLTLYPRLGPVTVSVSRLY